MNTIKKEVYEMERFTAKPKWWGKLRHKSRLTPSEFLVLDVIYDKTIDWNKTTDRISISQFIDELGMSNKGVINTLKSLSQKGLIFLLKQDRKTNTISIKMGAIEAYSSTPTSELSSQDKKVTSELSSQDKKVTSELSSQTSELCSYQLVNSVHTHDTRDHYPIPFLYDFLKKEKSEPCKSFEKKYTKREILANELFEFWKLKSGQAIKSTKPRLGHIKARLKDGYTPDQIKTAMQYVATDNWHIKNSQNRIEIAVRSIEQIDKKLLAASKKTNTQGQTYENNQSANQAPTGQRKKSEAQIYAEQLAHDLAEHQARQPNNQ